MKKLFKIIIIPISFIVLLLGYLDQRRAFYLLSNDQYITIWKRLNDVCYIVPGKYYGITAPDNYVKTSNGNYLDVIYFDNKIIVKGLLECETIGSSKNNKIYNYMDNKQKNDSLFLKGGWGRSDAYDYKINVIQIFVSIREPYATDRYGKKL